jgi:peptide methionine sulfoxide reductase MsrB
LELGDLDELKTVPESDPKIGYKVQERDGESSDYSRMPRFCVNGVSLRFEEESD